MQAVTVSGTFTITEDFLPSDVPTKAATLRENGQAFGRAVLTSKRWRTRDYPAVSTGGYIETSSGANPFSGDNDGVTTVEPTT